MAERGPVGPFRMQASASPDPADRAMRIATCVELDSQRTPVFVGMR